VKAVIIVLSIDSIIVSCPETTSVQYGDLRGPFLETVAPSFGFMPLWHPVTHSAR